MTIARSLAAFGFAVAALVPAQAQSVTVDLELVLAVDASGSVDQNEFVLQMSGIATAFRDPAVHAAIAGNPKGRIAVSTLIWAEASRPKQQGPWHLIETPADAETFARFAESRQRMISGGTGIGAGVAWAIRMLDNNGIEGDRHVVDVSGDGPETPPRETVVLIGQARAMALSRGVTVNGLAILADDPQLGEWYSSQVIAGPDSFVTTAAGFEDFARAMKRKLLHEIKPEPRLSRLEPAFGMLRDPRRQANAR